MKTIKNENYEVPSTNVLTIEPCSALLDVSNTVVGPEPTYPD